MVYAGTVTVTKVAKNVLKIHAADFDADGETTTIDLDTYRMEGAGEFSIQAQRTAGSENVISFKLDASNDGTNFTQIRELTAANSWDTITGKACRYIRINCTTVGAGNTLDGWLYVTIG